MSMLLGKIHGYIKDWSWKLGCWLLAQYIRLVYATNHWEVRGAEIPDSFWKDNRPFILAFWHSRILLMPYCWHPDRAIHMLISQHQDGKLISDTVAWFGINTVAGSTGKGGASALRTMVKLLKSGACVGITPDGPRGPALSISEGTRQLARLAGVPVIPCTFAVNRCYRFKSWDKFVWALPFGRGAFVWGLPVEAPAPEDFSAKLSSALNNITALAERLAVNSEQGQGI